MLIQQLYDRSKTDALMMKIGSWRKIKPYMSTPTTLLKVTTGRSSMSGMLPMCLQNLCFCFTEIFIWNRTEGPRSGPPEVLTALMEGGQEVDSSQYWFHLHIKLETGHEKYQWMNNRLIIARATRIKGEVAYDAYFVENP